MRENLVVDDRKNGGQSGLDSPTETGLGFVVVLKCRSSVRFPFERGAEFQITVADLGQLNVRVLTGWQEVGLDHPLPRELYIEVNLLADSVDEALDRARIVANGLVPMISFAVNAEIGTPETHIAYEELARDNTRQFVEYFVPDERGLVPPSREADPDVVVATADALMTSEHGKNLGTALSHYHSALGHYHLGGEAIAVEHLWMAAEALRKPTLVEYRRSTHKTDDQIMKEQGHENRHHLMAWVRRELIFKGDHAVYDPAFAASEGMEHGHLTVGESRALAEPVCDAAFGFLREAIVALLDIPKHVRDGLLDRYRAPADTQSLRRRVDGLLVGDAPVLAAPGFSHPVLEWSSRVAHFDINDEGQPVLRFQDRFTVRTADGISWQPTSYALLGRPGSVTGSHDASMEVISQEDAQAKDRVMPLAKQLASAAAGLGPGEAGETFPQQLAHLLELFYRTKGLYVASVQLLDSGHPEEALILGRVLLQDALRLDEAASSNEEGVGSLAFGWKYDSTVAASSVLDSWAESIAEDTTHIDLAERQKERILAAAERLGFPEIRTFSPTSDLMEKVEDEDLPRIDRLARLIQEGWDISTRSRLQLSEDGQLELHDSAPDSWLYPFAAKLAMGSFLLANRAAISLFGWEDSAGDLARFTAALDDFEAE